MPGLGSPVVNPGQRPIPVGPAKPTVNDRQAVALGTGANPRGVAIAQPKLGGAGVHQAIQEVFNHQDPVHQATIIKSVLNGKADPGTTKAIRDAWYGLPVDQRIALNSYLPHPSGLNAGQLLDTVVGSFANSVLPGIGGAVSTLASRAGKGLSAALSSKNPVDQQSNLPGVGTVLPFAGPHGPTQVAANAAKDAINLPAETFSTVGTLGSDVLQGKPGKLLSDLASPYEQLITHPGQMLYGHPLDTYLMVSPILHGASRVVGGAARTFAPDSALGRAAATERPGIQLAGNLTHERPRYSAYPSIKAGQVAVERARFARAPTGELVPRSPALRAKLTGLETSRLVGVNERIRQANRDAAISARAAAVRVPALARMLHGAKTALKYNPEHAAIPGASVLARVADATIRRPETFNQDLRTHIAQVSANRPNLLDNPKLLAEHDKHVQALTKAASTRLEPSELEQLFKAANAYARDYKPVETEAQRFGHFGARPDEALQKRALSHYAVTHMGAKFDPEKGLVDEAGAPLSIAAIKAHLNGPEGTGGRLPAFTSDRPRRGSAFYISSERRPLPANATNTLFAYTHGLTEPGHHALLEQHVRMQGIVDAHKAQNRLVNALAVMKKDGSAWPNYSAALQDAPPGYRPMALSEPFHPLASLDKALEGTDPANIEQEALVHGLDLTGRLTDHGQGRWALADENALNRIQQHTAQITSNPAMRAFKMTNNQFRQVALGTSAKHIPGVMQEGLIRDISNGVGLSSWITGRRLLSRAEQLDSELGGNARVQLTGGTVAGATKSMMTRQVSDHFLGTNLHGPLKAFETFMRAPGPRQMRGAWNAWIRFAINGTKKYIEEQNQTAGVGKAALRDFGAEHGPFLKAMRIQGSMLDDAAKGLFDPVKLRQFRAEIEHIYGRWTDLTPTGQTGLMLSPFGLWWTNSVKWLARSPIDRPMQTGALAAATMGTQNERNANGLDLFAPNAVPPYMQGGISLGNGKILAQNYYSPFGVANDPLQSAAGLIEPWMQSPLLGSLGDNYLGKSLNSPTNPRGYKPSNAGARAQYVINSLLASFLPLYSKAETIAEGGSSPYDSATLLNPQTKTPGKGPLAGIEKALTPFRLYHSGGGSVGRPATPSWVSGSSAPSWVSGTSSKPSWAP